MRTLVTVLVCLVMGAFAGFAVRPSVSRIVHPHPSPTTPDLTIPVEPDNPHRHLAFLRSKPAGSVSTLWLGDSIAEGWRDSPDLWKKYFPNSLNHGVSWDRVEHTHWRVINGELGSVKPHLIVLLIGTNNLSRGDSAGATFTGIQSLVATLRGRLPESQIVVLGILPRTPYSLMPSVRALNARLAELAGDKVRFIDIDRLFTLPDDQPDPLLLSDGVHPSPDGYEVLGQAITQ